MDRSANVIIDDIENILNGFDFGENLVARINAEGFFDELEGMVTSPAAKVKVAALRCVLDGAYTGDGGVLPGEVPTPNSRQRTLVLQDLSNLRKLIEAGR